MSEPRSEVACGATFFLRASAAARIWESDGAVCWAHAEAVMSRGMRAVDAEEEEDLAEEWGALETAEEGEAAVAEEAAVAVAEEAAVAVADDTVAEEAAVAVADDIPPAGVLFSAKSATKCLAKRRHMSPWYAAVPVVRNPSSPGLRTRPGWPPCRQDAGSGPA